MLRRLGKIVVQATHAVSTHTEVVQDMMQMLRDSTQLEGRVLRIDVVSTAPYYLSARGDFLHEGIVLALGWIVVNRLLDFATRLPFTNLPVPRYVLEIGLRYLAIVASKVAEGAVLNSRVEKQVA